MKHLAYWLFAALFVSSTFAQDTAFTYQGSLNDGAKPANGLYDLRFALYDAATSGTQQGNFITNTAIGITNGLFTVTLDFGNQFPGAARWLEIGVQTNGGSVFVTLAPRQVLTPIPYAIEANSVAAGGIIGPLNNSQLPSSVVTNGPGGVNISGVFSGNGSGLTNAAGSAFLPRSNGIAYGLGFASPVSGLGTNQNLGEVWATDFGFCSTNTATGNSNALNLAIQACINQGGGIIRYGAIGNAVLNGQPQVIQLAGEHIFPYSPGIRVKLQGDGSTIIQYTGTGTTVAVLAGQFDAENVRLYGPGTNASDVYPYTNSVGMYVGWNFDPQIKNCVIRGFGQGLAQGVSGAVRGALYESVDIELCDIAFAFGGQDDQTKLINSAGRSSIIGLDLATITPGAITNIPGYTQFAGRVGTSDNAWSSDVSVHGGIWDYDWKAVFMVGKGTLVVNGAYTGFEGGGTYYLVSPHPPFVTSVCPFPTEDGGTTITLDSCFDNESNDLKTNIWLLGTSSAPDLTIHKSVIGGGSGYGIVGEARALHVDPKCFFVDTNYLFNSVSFSGSGPFDTGTSVFRPVTYQDSTGSTFVPGQPVNNYRVQIGFINGITLWNWQAEDGGMNPRSSMSYVFNYGTNDQLSLNNAGLTVGAGSGQGNAVLSLATNATTPFPMGGYGRFWPSNYDLYWVTPTKTNLVVLGH